MSRVHLALLPIPVLALIVAFSACSRSRTDDAATHVIPPATSYAEPAARNAAEAAVAPRAPAEPPSPDELNAFARPVPK